ncbi:hypothetical protein RIR_jg3229.t1 [Rhizophagus irregularis DAOM 181602=DAOM 197198]|nr:hypothetical protein RIR_jg3229.t1 [Rhizophagus irregularis DAOM 181602=DAOM 197198]
MNHLIRRLSASFITVLSSVNSIIYDDDKVPMILKCYKDPSTSYGKGKIVATIIKLIKLINLDEEFGGKFWKRLDYVPIELFYWRIKWIN